jgi:two-component sensor histidine kinase
LGDLIENILSTFSSGMTLEKQLDIAAVSVDIETAIFIGLIVNELVTNSLKHGLSHANSPTLKVQLIEMKNRLMLTVSDNGKKPAQPSPANLEAGFGLHLVGILIRRLSGTLETSFENGTFTRIEIAHP